MHYSVNGAVLRQCVLSFVVFIAIAFGTAQANQPHEHDKDNHAQHADDAGQEHEPHTELIRFAPGMLQSAGIVQQIAKPGSLQRKLRLYGYLREDPARTSHIRARFPGTVRSVQVQTGDYVRAGQLLAEVESSQSLSIYSIRAPFAGQITERHANPGELTLEQSLFTLSDKRQLFVELQVFAGQLPEVQPGMPLEVRSAGKHLRSQILHLLPNAQGNATVLARAPLSNPDQQLQPGLFAEADVLLPAVPAQEDTLLVENTALQRIDNTPVVFTCGTAECRALPVATGASDGTFTLIRHGLQAGQSYVTQGSYLLKAELEKSSAGHSH